MASDVSAIIEGLCSVEPDRRPGSAGNRDAVDFVAGRFRDAGWSIDIQGFTCLDWRAGAAYVETSAQHFRVVPSPYGLGVDAVGPVAIATRASDLENSKLAGSILLVSGDLVSEPLTPKRFPFYGSDEHTAIVAALESVRPAAVIALTGRHPALCGALDPFPWIEDGDFEIPAASISPEAGASLFTFEGVSARVAIDATRIPSMAHNVIATAGPTGPRLTVCAHLDSKPGTPGAVDNAAGVAALILLAESIDTTSLPIGVELLAVNGEDHYGAPGEVAWLEANTGQLDDIALFINIDAAGYRNGRTAYSLYNVDNGLSAWVRQRFDEHDDLVEGPVWYQSDHAIFAMQGRPALAFTTEMVDELLEVLFHAPTDTPDQVSPERVRGLASALADLIATWG